MDTVTKALIQVDALRQNILKKHSMGDYYDVNYYGFANGCDYRGICCYSDYYMLGKYAKVTREQLDESERQFDENNRAFVNVTFEIIRSGLVVLNIQNIGHQIAKNVNIKINKEFLDNILSVYMDLRFQN